MTFQQDANTTYVNGQPVAKSDVRALWAAVDGVVANSAKSFHTRAAAVSAGQAALPSDLGMILVDEGDYYTVRGPNQTDDDPLFATAPRWGVRDRIPTQAVVDALRDEVRDGRVYYLPAQQSPSGVDVPSWADFVITSFFAGNTTREWRPLATGPSDGLETEDFAQDANGRWWRRVRDAAAQEERAERIAEDNARTQAIRVSVPIPIVVDPDTSTGDNIVAEIESTMIAAGITSVPTIGSIEYRPMASNEAANPTITIGALTASVRGADGQAWPAGGFVVGRVYNLRRIAGVFRVQVGDVSLAEIQAEATVRNSADRIIGVIPLTNIGGSGNAITAEIDPATDLSGFTAGRLFRLTAAHNNETGNITVQVSGTTRNLRDVDFSILPAEAIREGRTYIIETIGAQFARVVSAIRTLADAEADKQEAISHADAQIELVNDAPLLSDGSRSLMRLGGRDIMRMTASGPRLAGPAGGAVAAPEGGWAAVENSEGEVEFTAQAGTYGIDAVDRFMERGGVRYPVAAPAGTTRTAYILSVMGQSNADATEMNDPLPWRFPPMKHHIFTLDDIQGIRGGLRGWLGVPTPAGPKRLIPVQQDAWTWADSTIHSYGATAAARLGQLLGDPYPVFTVRSSAVGGTKIIGDNPGQGIWKDSNDDYTTPWNNWTQDIRDTFYGLTDLGYEVAGIFICFTHQEGDWQTAREVYATQLADMMDDREATSAEDAPGVPFHWFCDQASGSGLRSPMYRGGAWQSRLAIVDVVEARANATMVMPRYHMDFGINGGSLENIHHSFTSRTCPQGETFAHAMREVIKGREWRCPRMVSATVEGNNIAVDFDSLAPLMIDWTFCKVRPDAGFKIGDGSITVQSVTQTGQRQITLQCSASPAGQMLAYAWREQDAQDVSDIWAISTGAIRDGFEAPSLFLSGKRVLRPALGYTLQL